MPKVKHGGPERNYLSMCIEEMHNNKERGLIKDKQTCKTSAKQGMSIKTEHGLEKLLTSLKKKNKQTNKEKQIEMT